MTRRRCIFTCPDPNPNPLELAGWISGATALAACIAVVAVLAALW